jgi:glycosyltransferase involved in cell wall biosynthesis
MEGRTGGVVAIQQGARRNYLYARQLEAAGLLTYLGCDAAWPADALSLPAKLAGAFSPRLAGAIQRRAVPNIAPERLCSTIWPNLASATKFVADDERAFDLMDEALGLRLRLRGLKGAAVVLNYFGNGGSFLSFAKKRGALIVTDFISSPNLREVERNARAEWPNWDEESTPQVLIDQYRQRFLWLLELSDIYLCPSQSVADGLAKLPGFVADRLRISPYGAGGVVVGSTTPQAGRVMFAGSGIVRKGLPWLAQAAEILRQRGVSVEIVVAGAVSESIKARPESRNLTFLGHLDKKGMQREFSKADIFCLPSLSEGSATVTYEALAYGLPVITTPASGSVVSHGVDGLLIPTQDGQAIADAIENIVYDRKRRHSMSIAAKETAARYSDSNCGEVFLQVMVECLERAARNARGMQ